MAVEELSGIGLTNFMFFMVISVLFFITAYKKELDNTNIVIIFCSVSFLTQWGLNAAASANPLICGELKIQDALLYTIIPWLLILGLGNLFIINFPGWIRVFSNTIGMWLAYKFYSTPNVPTDAIPTSGDPQYIKMYSDLLEQPQTIINEINILNKKDDAEILTLLKDKYEPFNKTIFNDENNPKIIEIMKYKNKVGILIWNILFGLIATMISTNSLLNSGCSVNII